MYTYLLIVNRVIDGDTVVGDIDLGFGVWLRDRHIRVAHVNAPEINTDSGKMAREFTINTLKSAGNRVTIQVLNHKADKYGRILADVLLNDTSLSKALIDAKMAVRYDP